MEKVAAATDSDGYESDHGRASVAGGAAGAGGGVPAGSSGSGVSGNGSGFFGNGGGRSPSPPPPPPSGSGSSDGGDDRGRPKDKGKGPKSRSPSPKFWGDTGEAGYKEQVMPDGSVGAAKAWTTKARIKAAELPNEGKIRFVPDDNYHPSVPIPRGDNNGYRDKFGNEWTKGPSRTPGQPFEWDVQLSDLGRKQLGWASRDGKHLNVSLDGKITHR